MIRRFFGTSNPFRLSPGWKVVSYAILGVWSIVILFPLYWLLITAFKAPPDVSNGPKYIPFVDFQPTTSTWHDLLADPSAGDIASRPYYNTFVVGTPSSFLSVVFGSAPPFPLLLSPSPLKLGVIFLVIGC